MLHQSLKARFTDRSSRKGKVTKWMLQEFFPHLFCTLCLYPAPYDRAKVTCVCVYSNLRFSVCVWLRSCAQKNQSNGRAHGCEHAQIFCAHGLIHAHKKSRVIGVRMAMCTSKPIIGKCAGGGGGSLLHQMPVFGFGCIFWSI